MNYGVERNKNVNSAVTFHIFCDVLWGYSMLKIIKTKFDLNVCDLKSNSNENEKNLIEYRYARYRLFC
jgi:hypothetical protein